MKQVSTQLAYLGEIAEKLRLNCAVTYVFKLGCGCSVYSKENVLAHTWEGCEYQGGEFWSDRYLEEGRTVKHHLREDEIEGIFGNVEVSRAELPGLLLRQKELVAECEWKNTHEYVKILKDTGHPVKLNDMTILEEKELAERVKAWYLKEDLNPPQYQILHFTAVALLAAEAVVVAFEEDSEVSKLVLFGD
jgi:hypothetical protein